MYDVAGMVLALAVAAVAWRCSRTRGGYYARGVYGMDRAAHLRQLAGALAFAAFFAFAYAMRLETAGIAALALYALIAVFYLSSFLRGAADYDE